MTLRTAHEPNRVPACDYQRARRPSQFGLIAHTSVADLHAAPPATDSAIRQMEQCALPASAQSCRTARRFAGRTLNQWGVPQLADDLFLVVSELVTNAVRHGVGLAPEPPALDGTVDGVLDIDGALEADTDRSIQVTLFRDDRHLICAVIDPSDAPPVVADVEDSREGGRGLRLVEAFSQLWGWAPIRSGGKMVWAAFAVPDRLGRRIH